MVGDHFKESVLISARFSKDLTTRFGRLFGGGKKKSRIFWGQEITRDRNMDLIAMYHMFSPSQGTRIDDQTWRDLAMDEVFAKIDRTSGVPGRQVLYHQMRTLIEEDRILDERANLYARLRSDNSSREALQPLLASLEGNGAYWLAPLLLNPLPGTPSFAWLLYISSVLSVALSCILLVTLILGLSFPPVFLFSLLGLMIVNLVINETFGRRITPYLPGFGQLKRLLQLCLKLAEIKRSQDLPQIIKLEKSLPLISQVRKRLRWVILDQANLPEIVGMGLGWLNLVFLFEVVFFLRTLPLLHQHQTALAELLETVGSLDAALSVASYLDGLPRSTVPVLTERSRIEVRGLYHPLITTAVANGLTLEGRSALITGSNMAGKTTFIRTVGINVILAQTLHICLAEEATLPKAVPRSSIHREDRLQEGQSYYFVELERLREFIEVANAERLQFFLIDEIFRGTNTLERLAASAAVLRHLSRNHLVLVTTHDLELHGLLEDGFDMYHFSEQVVNGHCGFDYLIHPGPARSRNAIRLLALNGYPEAITREASALTDQLADAFDGRVQKA
jgi:hypothetical protein